MNPNAVAAANHYIAKGIAKIPAVGIVSVFDAGESGLDPTKENNSGTEKGGVLNPDGAIGLAQLNAERQQRLANFAKKKGLDWRDLNTQLDFTLTEAWDYYSIVKDAILRPGIDLEDFITVFVEKYEIPGDPASEISRSLAEAQALFPLVGLPPPSPTPTPSPSPTPTPMPTLVTITLSFDPATGTLKSFSSTTGA